MAEPRAPLRQRATGRWRAHEAFANQYGIHADGRHAREVSEISDTALGDPHHVARQQVPDARGQIHIHREGA